MYNQRMVKTDEKIEQVEPTQNDSKEELTESLNSRISQLCRIVALMIAVITFATTILGEDNARFVILGLSLSVALLAIAGLQSHVKSKK